MPDPLPETRSENFVRVSEALPDEWNLDAPIPLDGRLERSGFPPLLTIGGGLIIAFLLFQGISTVVTLIFVVLVNGVPLSDLVTDMEMVLRENAGELIVANSVGQILGLLLPAILFARLHSSNLRGFLRLRKSDLPMLGLTVLGFVALVPIVQWVGGLVDVLPWPQAIRDFEQAQMDMIENILDQDFSIVFAISMMALTPAICEEVLFRGYIQRQAERTMGTAAAIVFSGLIFGLYHLRPTQALPLGLLGIYMAYITWRSGSLVPAILVHLANNTFAVALGRYMKSRGDAAVDLESIQIPMYIVLPSVAVLVIVTYIFHRTAASQLYERSVAKKTRTLNTEL